MLYISIELATKNQIESINNTNIDSVLVSATSFDVLKAAYPNYFTDISQFVDIMREILKWFYNRWFTHLLFLY